MVSCLAAHTARPAAALLDSFTWPHPRAIKLFGNFRHSGKQQRHGLGSSTGSSSSSSSWAVNSRSHVCRSIDSSNVASSSVEAGRPLNITVGPGLHLFEQAYSVQGRVLRLISPMDVDAVLDYYIAQGLDRDPYWCRAWPSAICLAQQLLHRPELVKGKKVADFGSGLGVAGLAAALAGAKEVVLLDREPVALYCGLLSATATGIAGVAGTEQMQQLVEQEVHSSSHGGNSAQAVLLAQLLQQQKQQQQQQQQQKQQQQEQAQATAVEQLPKQTSQQEAPQQQVAILPLQQQPAVAQCTYRALPFDWNSSKVTERYDVVLACDVLYESEAVGLVASVIPKLLKPGNSSSLLLADPPNRTVANRQRFLDLIAAAQPTRLLLQESGVEQCDVQQLDPEMLGGVTSDRVSVQFMVFQSAVGNDTIGLKSL